MFDRTSSSLGPLPFISFRFTTMQSRATGIADHVLPLGDLFFSRVNATLFNQLHVYPSIRFFLLPYDLSVTSYNSMILSGIFSCFFFCQRNMLLRQQGFLQRRFIRLRLGDDPVCLIEHFPRRDPPLKSH